MRGAAFSAIPRFMTSILTPLAASLPATVPFTGPETLERRRGRPFLARLGANENGFGPSPRAVAAMAQAAGEVWMYGDPDNFELRTALAKHLGVAADQVVVGEGIDGLLELLVRLTVSPGEAVVTSVGGYPTFTYHVVAHGGDLHRVPYRDDHEDLEALVAKAGEVGAKLVYLANPDNPMGSWHEGAAIVAALDALPPGCLLVLDEAYIEFAPEAAVPAVLVEDPRVIRLRTFSKAYGMAGARVGYAFGPRDLIGAFDRVRNHFGVNRIGQAGALAALADGEWLTRVVGEVAASRDRIAAIGAEHGLRPLPSATNFVALDAGGADRAKALVDGLAREGVFVRMPGAAPLDRCIRVSCGPEAAMAAFEAALARL